MKKTKNEKIVKQDVLKSNLVKKVTLEVLNEKHNALARYIGIPCVLEASEIIKGAVFANGSINDTKNFACYRVDLGPFKGQFDKVRFQAASNGKKVAFAMLVADDDSLEFVAEAKKAGEGTVVMPLSPNSKTLYATMPAKNGKPAWKKPTIELLPNGGIITNFNEALNALLDRIQAIEERLEKNPQARA